MAQHLAVRVDGFLEQHGRALRRKHAAVNFRHFMDEGDRLGDTPQQVWLKRARP